MGRASVRAGCVRSRTVSAGRLGDGRSSSRFAGGALPFGQARPRLPLLPAGAPRAPERSSAAPVRSPPGVVRTPSVLVLVARAPVLALPAVVLAPPAGVRAARALVLTPPAPVRTPSAAVRLPPAGVWMPSAGLRFSITPLRFSITPTTIRPMFGSHPRPRVARGPNANKDRMGRAAVSRSLGERARGEGPRFRFAGSDGPPR